MSEPSGSGQQPKAIASLAKKQSDTTRGGGARLKFVPTIPARRAKVDVKQEEVPAAAPTSRGERGRGRGQDRGRGRGRGGGGEGRGGPPRPPAVEMTASGPFAMGPTLAGTSARRTAPRSNFTPIVPQGPGGPKLGAGLTQTTAPTLKREKGEKEKKADDDDHEVYSDPDEGVEIVDMDDIKKMDWMAPESLGKEKTDKKKSSKKKTATVTVKEEESEPVLDRKGKGVAVEDPMDVGEGVKEEVNLANALDLSDSEDEEELEDIIDDFSVTAEVEEDSDIRQERLYFFQFPNPFPTFVARTPQPAADTTTSESPKPEDSQKKVTFAQDTKPPAAGSSVPGSASESKTEEEPKIDGVIGQLEVYQSGAVKMRLSNGILLDVSAATQPSFLQQAVHVDPTNKRICVLGEVNRRFVVSPNLDALLSSMELADNPPSIPFAEGLITMDTT